MRVESIGIWKSLALSGTLEENLWNWLCNLKVSIYLDLPFFIIWGVWLHRNKVLIENVVVDVQLTIIKVIGAFKDYSKG